MSGAEQLGLRAGIVLGVRRPLGQRDIAGGLDEALELARSSPRSDPSRSRRRYTCAPAPLRGSAGPIPSGMSPPGIHTMSSGTGASIGLPIKPVSRPVE